MRIAIILATQNAGWVIGKMAHRLCDALRELGHEASVVDTPDAAADINHWMSYAFADGCPTTLNTMLVTHADDPFKVRLIRRLLEGPIQLALCMSPHAADELGALGVDRQRLWHVLPALDVPLTPRRICIGITSRVYDDGRKREDFLVRLSREMSLERFRFEVFGEGWMPTLQHLRDAGAEVQYDPGSEDLRGDYNRICRAVPGFDYYLYMGMDEGSLGTLDAVSAGVKTIVTAQGFHLSIPGGITHPFTDYPELASIFRHLDDEQATRGSLLQEWTWSRYAREHLGLWQAMLRHGRTPVPQAELTAATGRDAVALKRPLGATGRIAKPGLAFRSRVLHPTRIRGAIARLPWLRPLRKLLGH